MTTPEDSPTRRDEKAAGLESDRVDRAADLATHRDEKAAGLESDRVDRAADLAFVKSKDDFEIAVEFGKLHVELREVRGRVVGLEYSIAKGFRGLTWTVVSLVLVALTVLLILVI